MSWSSSTRPCLFLDRDGVINIDTGYPYRKKDLILINGAGKAIARMNKLKFLVVVVTNQSGVARGYFTEDDVHQFHQYIQEALLPFEAHIDQFYLCPYHPDGVIFQYKQNHITRKPNPGMIEKAISDLNINKTKSFLIGDKQSDIDAAHNANIDAYLFKQNNLNDFLSNILTERHIINNN